MSRNVPPTRTLRARPDLDQLKRQAKELLEAVRSGDADAVAEVATYFPGVAPDAVALHDTQLVLARSYGFASWPKLKAHVDGVTMQEAADAVRAGHVDQVRAMLERRPELAHVDMADHNEHQLLHYAVLARAPEMVRLLMQFGADAHKGIYPHRDATTALTIASDRGYDEIVAIIREEEAARRKVLAGSAAAAAPTIDAVVEAIGTGQHARAKAMLDAEPALINAYHRDGWAPLHAAAATLDRSMTAWLLDHGADVNVRGVNGRTPLDVAAELRHMPDMPGPRWTARLAEYVARRRFRAIAADLRRCGADLSPASAVALGESDWLRARHAERSLVLDASMELLTIAVKHDRAVILDWLLSLGLDVNERTRLAGVDNVIYSAGMPLHHSASIGNLATAKRLLDAGADPNVQVYAAGSAMYRACTNGNDEMIELLSRYGGVADGVTVGSLNHVDKARQLLDDEAAGRLPDAARIGIMGGQAAVEDLIWGAAGAGAVEIVRMCLDRVDWPRTDSRWYVILRELFYAPHDTSVECFRLVLPRCDASILTGTGERGWMGGRSLLHDLSAGRHEMRPGHRVTIATLLLDGGARLNVRDDLLKSTPLGWACRWGRVELVQLFLARGADPVEADAEPWATPRAWASRNNHDAVLRMVDAR